MICIHCLSKNIRANWRGPAIQKSTETRSHVELIGVMFRTPWNFAQLSFSVVECSG
jgi:hypothetical protein